MIHFELEQGPACGVALANGHTLTADLGTFNADDQRCPACRIVLRQLVAVLGTMNEMARAAVSAYAYPMSTRLVVTPRALRGLNHVRAEISMRLLTTRGVWNEREMSEMQSAVKWIDAVLERYTPASTPATSTPAEKDDGAEVAPSTPPGPRSRKPS